MKNPQIRLTLTEDSKYMDIEFKNESYMVKCSCGNHCELKDEDMLKLIEKELRNMSL